MKRRHFLEYSLLFLAGCSTATQTANNVLKRGKPELLRFTVTDFYDEKKLAKGRESDWRFPIKLLKIIKEKLKFFLSTETGSSLSLLYRLYHKSHPSEQKLLRKLLHFNKYRNRSHRNQHLIVFIVKFGDRPSFYDHATGL